ncbi:hypothetical protein INT48_004844 [Thamnidium elegans]|uniref:Uncharacterized protein n=1 Tax=Thamnidium elegans TaxID=101142 RepID=A0A8H7SU01_9FUNG|nr:hypothetical protein INT48_004844 [Thamnidium elegans]
MYLQDFQGNTIKSITALANKDAVFNSFFNSYLLKVKTADYRLLLSNRIHILLGLKTVRVYGTYENLTQTLTDEVPEKPKYQESDSKVKAMNDQRSVLQNRMKDQVKKLDAFLLGNDSVCALRRKRRDNVDGERKYSIRKSKQ